MRRAALPWYIVRRCSGYKTVSRPEGIDVVETKSSVPPVSVPTLLENRIRTGGAISIADYMRLVLTSKSGYYMTKDVFGRHGDFVTSPEVSRIFGDVLGVWLLHELDKIGSPRPLQLVELGPGRGTLTNDVIRVLRHFKALHGVSVHLVEVSPELSLLQAKTLCQELQAPSPTAKQPYFQSGTTEDGVPVFWYKRLDFIPRVFSLVLAHEFFDALPIHKFQKTQEGWREVLVSIRQGSSNSSPLQLEYVQSAKETSICQMLIRKDEERQHVEVCPEAGLVATQLAQRIDEDGGFALIIDYGHMGDKTDTFRAFKKHKLHDPLLEPGSADLTADVDFRFLRDVMGQKLLTVGPVSQGEFLKRLGIEARLKMLLSDVDETTAEHMTAGYHMLVDNNQMGARFQVFAAFPKVLESHLQKFPVAGFQ